MGKRAVWMANCGLWAGSLNPNDSADAIRTPYQVEWKPIEAFCTPETIAQLPDFTQATIKASQDTSRLITRDGQLPASDTTHGR